MMMMRASNCTRLSQSTSSTRLARTATKSRRLLTTTASASTSTVNLTLTSSLSLPLSSSPSSSLSLSRSSSRCFSSSPSVNANPRSVIVRLLENIGSKKEVDQYLKYYSSLDVPRFAVIKVGGGCLMGEELGVLADSLAFLADVGLVPVVLHGAGPQLNDELREKGIVSDYIGGMRITTPEILRVARQVFLRENAKLVRALEERGTKARPIVSGVFEAEFLDKEKMQYVGQVTRVDIDQVHDALSMGSVPILTCMGESVCGQILNINADVAGQELAKALKPVKVVYISAKGGLFDKDGALIPNIDLDLDYPTLMTESWFKYGDRLKLKEIKTLLDELPLSSSVAITDSQNLPKELFTHKGSGTLVRRSEKINVFNSYEGIDIARLSNLIEDSFHGALVTDYLKSIEKNIHRIYLSENYRAVAVITKGRPNASSSSSSGLSDQSDEIPYLDKFAVSKLSQGEGTAQQLWNFIKKDHANLFWRSRDNNFINSWYFERAQGSFASEPWVIFWYGIKDFNVISACVKNAQSRSPTIDRTRPPPPDSSLSSSSSPSSSLSDPVPLKAGTVTGTRSFSTLARHSAQPFVLNVASSISKRRRMTTSSFARSFSSSVRSPLPHTRIGLIGARGHTGSELMKLIGAHPSLELTVASSRQLKGQKVSEVFFKGEEGKSKTAAKFENVTFVDVTPADIVRASSNVDVWVLALPNDLAAPYADALDDGVARGALDHVVKIVDLSADFRFSTEQHHDKNKKNQWVYGLPERHGQREAIKRATRVANPGCYATGSQIALLPLIKHLDLSYAPSIFGVSGYSGAGTTPSRKNDVSALANNLMPYSLVNHMHEREVSFQLSRYAGSEIGVRFMPHVASWFRGIQLTVAVDLSSSSSSLSPADFLDLYNRYYAGEPLVHVSSSIPEVAANANKHHVSVGGFTRNSGRRAVVCATIDNLLKGAASQCMQNINIMQGYNELDGLQL